MNRFTIIETNHMFTVTAENIEKAEFVHGHYIYIPNGTLTNIAFLLLEFLY